MVSRYASFFVILLKMETNMDFQSFKVIFSLLHKKDMQFLYNF